MTSVIAQQLKVTNKVHFLVVLNFSGEKKYFSDSVLAIDDHIFEDRIINISDITQSFDIRNFKYSYSSISVTVKNGLYSKDRLQDIDSRCSIDGSPGDIYIWTPGVSWNQLIQEGPKFSGVFQEERFDNNTYTFNLVDKSESKFLNITNRFINENTFPGHDPDITSQTQKIIFGKWDKVPLERVKLSSEDIWSGYRYFISVGLVYSSLSAFSNEEEYVYNGSGTTYTFVPTEGHIHNAVDDLGGIYSFVEFLSAQTVSEPLTCTIEGIKDQENQLIKHPADIFEYTCGYYSIFSPNEIDKASIASLKSSAPWAKCASIVDDNINSSLFIDRVLNSFLCSRIIRGNKIGLVYFDLYGSPMARFNKEDHNIGSILIEKTDFNLICNDLTIFYNIDIISGNYRNAIKRNRDNDSKCKSSYLDYGEKVFEKVLNLSDVNETAIANNIAQRYLDFFSHRHHILKWDLRYCDAYDLQEGDVALITLPEGGNVIPNTGWIDEKFILFEKNYRKNCISTTWWKIDPISNYKKTTTTPNRDNWDGGGGVLGWLGEGWLGDGWL